MHVGSALFYARGDGFDERLRARHRRHAGHIVLQCCAPNRLFVVVRGTTKGCINYERDLTTLYVVHNVWSTFVDLKNSLDRHSNFKQPRCCSKGGDDAETQTSQLTSQQNRCSFVGIVNT